MRFLLPIALACSGMDAGARDAEGVARAIDKGVAFLRSAQARSGAIGGQAGPTALALYALVKSGVATDDPVVERALVHLARQEASGTYELACIAMALAAIDPLEHRDWLAEIVESLLATQNPAGDWGYPAGADLSNTQYAALGLRAAEAAGLEVPRECWQRLAEVLRSYRLGTSGGYGYRPGSDATGSMTCAGVGTIAMCRERLAGELSAGECAALDRDLRRGLDWLGRRFTVESNPAGHGWTYYYLYGLERVGALAGTATIGGHDWYAEGAAWLVATQEHAGSWGGNDMQPARTAFALLFLRRATRVATTGGGSGPPPAATTGPAAPVQLVAHGDGPLTLWIAGFGEEVLDRLAWPGERARGLHVARVVYFADEQPIGIVEGDRLRPCGSERFALRHEPVSAGALRLRARIHAAAPERAADGSLRPGELYTIDSPEIVLAARSGPPAWLAEQHGDRASDRMHLGRPRAQASSSFAGAPLAVAALGARGAVDHRARTAWLAEPDDARPWLRIDLQQPQRARRLLVSQARTLPWRPGALGRALELRISINGGEPHRLRMPHDERRKAVLELDAPVLVRQIELHVALRVHGSETRAVGIAEVELQDAPAR